jgi:hypothetical protein
VSFIFGSKKKKDDKKSAAPAPPSFQPSAVMYGDQLVGKTYQDPKLGIVSQYMPTAEEQARQRMSQERINQLLPTLGQTAPEIAAQFDQSVNDYADDATAQFMRQFSPLMRATREDYASRFGGLNNSPYLDRMQEMEETVRMPALASIARQASSMRQDLFDKDQARKLRELQALGYTLNEDQSNFITQLQTPNQNAQLGNQFNQNTYLYDLQRYQQQQANQMNATNTALGFLGRILG